MTAQELAALLHGRQYRSEMTREEATQARIAGLLVVFGASDDLTEFEGVLRDEAGAYPGAEHSITAKCDLFEPTEDARDLIKRGWTPPPIALRVKAEWCPEDFDGSWRITADCAPELCASFDVMEDDALYCRGIVVNWRGVLAALEGGR